MKRKEKIVKLIAFALLAITRKDERYDEAVKHLENAIELVKEAL